MALDCGSAAKGLELLLVEQEQLGLVQMRDRFIVFCLSNIFYYLIYLSIMPHGLAHSRNLLFLQHLGKKILTWL